MSNLSLSPKSLRIDFYVTVAFVLFATFFTILVRPPFLVSTLLFFALPAIYLLLRKPRPLSRIAAASLLFGVILMFEMDFLAQLNDAWAMARPLVAYRPFGFISLDFLIWGVFWVLFIITFYEHFFEHERGGSISPRFKYGLFPALAVLVVMLLFYWIKPAILHFGYAYLALGIASLAPFAFQVFRSKVFAGRFAVRFFKTALFFFFVHLAHELTAVWSGQWYFPGQFIGHVELANITFPIEEFVFWIVLSTAVLLANYEYFVDDLR